mgnify:CR=1 FL=1
MTSTTAVWLLVVPCGQRHATRYLPFAVPDASTDWFRHHLGHGTIFRKADDLLRGQHWRRAERRDLQGGPHAPVLVDGGWQGVHPTYSVRFLLELSVDQGLRAGPAFSRYSHTAVVETTARIDVGRDVLFFAFFDTASQ